MSVSIYYYFFIKGDFVCIVVVCYCEVFVVCLVDLSKVLGMSECFYGFVCFFFEIFENDCCFCFCGILVSESESLFLEVFFEVEVFFVEMEVWFGEIFDNV